MRSIVDLCGNPVVFGPWLKDKATWGAWEAFLCVLFGLPMFRGPARDLPRLYVTHRAAEQRLQLCPVSAYWTD